MYYLSDGSAEFIAGDRDERLRDLIRDHMGADMATCFDDVVSDIRVDVEEQVDKYLDEQASSLCSRIEAIIYNLSDYIKAPDSLKRQLKDLILEIKDCSTGFYAE